MGRITTLQMIEEARTMFGHPSDAEYSDALLLRQINDAQLLDIACLYALPELDVVLDKTLSAGAVTIDLAPATDADAFVNIHWVIRALPDSYQLEEFNRFDLGKMAGYLTSPSGGPVYWLWSRDSSGNSGTQLRVWPKADQEYAMKLVVTRRPKPLASGDRTELGEIWDGILTHFFAARFANILGMITRSAMERSYAKELANAAGYQVNHASAMWHKISSPVNYSGRLE